MQDEKRSMPVAAASTPLHDKMEEVANLFEESEPQSQQHFVDYYYGTKPDFSTM